MQAIHHQLFSVLLLAGVLTLQSERCLGALSSLNTVYQRIYQSVEDVTACFRLTNSTSQIGCSASVFNTSGVLWYADSQDSLSELLNGSQAYYPPYIALIEPVIFTSDNVLEMTQSENVNGIIVRYDGPQVPIPEDVSQFSPAQKCPNGDIEGAECENDHSWNQNGTALSRMDFGNFPIFAVQNTSFDQLLNCSNEHNSNLSGKYSDYPLCSAELQADMQAVISTERCFERGEKILLNLGIAPCEALGDYNVWNSLFEITDNNSDIVVLATKLDTSSFFLDESYGADNDAAAIVTQLAVAQALGKIKNNPLSGTDKNIMMVFYQGESWGYIGSSRMIYDMNNNVFPAEEDSSKDQLPLLHLDKVTDFLELSQVGMDSSGTVYLHTTENNAGHLVSALRYHATDSLTLNLSTIPYLPPSSLKMFTNAKPDISGVVITDYDTQYNNRFFGGRYDTLFNLYGNNFTEISSNDTVVQHLTQLATTVARALLNVSGANPEEMELSSVEADSEVIVQLLECYLYQTNCSLLRAVLVPDMRSTLDSKPENRYVTVSAQTNPITLYTFQLLANFTGDRSVLMNCSDCLESFNSTVQRYNTTWFPYSSRNDENSTMCYCTNSSTYVHMAESPAFLLKNYTSTNYSTWAESRWLGVSMRIYLVTYTLLEVALFFCGVAVLLISLLVATQCYRKGRQVFMPAPANTLGIVNSSLD